MKKATTLLDDLLQNAGGCAVIDGGLATQLEKHGAVFNDSLWSAVCLIKDPDLIKKVLSYRFCLLCFGASRSHRCLMIGLIFQVHLEYLEAGADILVSSSYQVCNADGLSFIYTFLNCIHENFCTMQSVTAFAVPFSFKS